MKWRFPLILCLLLLAICVTAWVAGWTPHRVFAAWKDYETQTAAEKEKVEKTRADTVRNEPDSADPSSPTWTGRISITPAQRRAIGLTVAKVEPQTEPTELRLFGTTDYDPDTVNKVRVQFDSRVERVHAKLGERIKAGDPLLDLFSNALAEAKSTYESKYAQWMKDRTMLDKLAPLAKTEDIPKNRLLDLELAEAGSNLDKKLARDKLLIFGLTDREIEDSRNEDGSQKAKMTIRAKVGGVVIKRDVGPQNYYQTTDELMSIAPLDHFWIWVNVSEGDSDKVREGQDVTVHIPSLQDFELKGKVEYVANQVDPDTRSVRFRVTVPNRAGRLRAGMYVRASVKIAPVEKRTVIPRFAMVSVDRDNYVFVRHAGAKGEPDRFERRAILPVQESDQTVIVSAPSAEHAGLVPGEDVAVLGSIFLEQMYEDKYVVANGSTP
ncbi:MAG: hypothetical protein NVSMB14_07230 [Isosphaeraceae bacterium]